ncbi:hypothetical protein QSJ18_12345 [Gordonia sp. ABSL1-1]|uniref:hypothetical protein n=1 Tax=Gordonia sp. ABSL1-1 TaxID=3053923 RepID=UPI0025722800|nr:hypothetical protein [Gordonia sp. ABSL1-1]MDL9937538.1 hypothetical protein [Gordonia sp. ABSL1-1]
MQGLLALLFPAVLMLFAMAMDKVQSRLDRLAVSREHVEDFLATAGSDDVDTLAREGMPAALDELRTRRVTKHETATGGRDEFDEPHRSPQRAS